MTTRSFLLSLLAAPFAALWPKKAVQPAPQQIPWTTPDASSGYRMCFEDVDWMTERGAHACASFIVIMEVRSGKVVYQAPIENYSYSTFTKDGGAVWQKDGSVVYIQQDLSTVVPNPVNKSC